MVVVSGRDVIGTPISLDRKYIDCGAKQDQIARRVDN